MNRFFVLLFTCLIYFNTSAQESVQTIVAKKGDGIFSILREQGLDPSKYYVQFVELNKENINNGSELSLGKTYKIPQATDSFIDKGRTVNVANGQEESLYKEKLKTLSLKSRNLSDAVYYLVAEGNTNQNVYSKTIVSQLAHDFLINGAQVYVISSDSIALNQDENFRFQEYIEIVNKRYIKNSGKYQRLLIVRSRDVIKNKNITVAIKHHQNSEEGQKFARSIETVIGSSGTSKKNIKNLSGIFEESNDLYLAKNALPTVSVIDISSNDEKLNKEQFSMYSDRKTFANLLKKAMLNDYTELHIEE